MHAFCFVISSQPSVQTLANLLDEVIRVNTRLEPCVEKCRDLIRTDGVLVGSVSITYYALNLTLKI